MLNSFMLFKKIKSILMKYGFGLLGNFLINSSKILCNEFLIIYIGNILHNLISTKQFDGIYFSFILMIGANFLSNFLNIISKLSDYYVYPSLEKELRSNLFSYSHNLSIDFIFTHGEGYLESLLNSISDGIMETIQYVLESILPCFLLLISFLIYISYVNISLGLVHILWMAIYGVVFIMMYTKTLKISKEFNHIKNYRSSILVDIFKNIKIIRVFDLSRILSGRVNNIFNKETNTYANYLISDCKNTVVVTFLYVILEMTTYFLLYQLIINNMISITNGLLILKISSSIIDCLNDLLEKFIDVYESMGQASQSYNQLLNIQSINHNGIDLIGPITSIKVIDLSYSINGKVIFNNLNLSLETGDRLVIVGESGIGKSTLLNLLLKLVNPPNNTIFINGIDINKYNIFSIYRTITYLGQNNSLFNVSIVDNLKFANPLASREEIVEALRMANISQMENKLDKLTGSAGSHLSGGEAKRLSMARAYLRNTSNNEQSLFIADEPTSALDRPNQKNMLELMNQQHNIFICTDHSGIFPPHPSITKILFIEKGGIGIVSTHEQLLKKSSYNKFFI